MKTITITRRQVLRGTGGITLGLPFLPSLFPRRADGAEPTLAQQKFFVAACTQHGAIGDASMYPAAAALAQSKEIHPGHTARYGALPSRIDGSNRIVSAVLRAPSSKFSEKMVAKMNVMRGFDIPYYIGHHTGGHLGNFLRSDQGPKTLQAFATIDQVMAWSNKFYPNTDGIRSRSIVTGQNFHGQSWTWSNPATKSGAIQKVQVESSALALFDKLVAGGMSKPMGPTRAPIVDKVLANYKHLRESDRRLSKHDRQRIEDHMGALAELERRVKSTANSASCAEFTKPTQDSSSGGSLDNPTAATRFFGLLNDVIAMSFACGSSRIATVWIHSAFADYPGSWHQDTAHQWQNADAQQRLVAGLRNTFEFAILDLANKLDAIELSPGRTVLDSTLYQWTQESGWATHDAQDMPIVTFGGAGGYFKTGQFVDFRSLGARNHLDIFGQQKQFTGLWVRQWLATALQAMGVPPAEFEQNGKTGYGDAFYSSGYDRAVHANVINRASDPVPIVVG